VDHWEQIYATRPSSGVSWFQREPAMSLRLILAIASGPSTGVVDIGAGASSLVDALIRRGFRDVTVLDVAGHALAEVRRRLGEEASRVTFVEHDVLTWVPDRQYEIWHDRAVFHFLTERDDRDRYVALAAGAVRTGGYVIAATFAEVGPTQCSGLPVCRYSAGAISDVFSPSFSLVSHEREEHVTPQGIVQPFVWVVLQRVEFPR
jgi:Methyltransferase domain